MNAGLLADSTALSRSAYVCYLRSPETGLKIAFTTKRSVPISDDSFVPVREIVQEIASGVRDRLLTVCNQSECGRSIGEAGCTTERFGDATHQRHCRSRGSDAGTGCV